MNGKEFLILTATGIIATTIAIQSYFKPILLKPATAEANKTSEPEDRVYAKVMSEIRNGGEYGIGVKLLENRKPTGKRVGIRVYNNTGGDAFSLDALLEPGDIISFPKTSLTKPETQLIRLPASEIQLEENYLGTPEAE